MASRHVLRNLLLREDKSTRLPLTPSDCRVIKKILDKTRDASPSNAAYESAKREELLGLGVEGKRGGGVDGGEEGRDEREWNSHGGGGEEAGENEDTVEDVVNLHGRTDTPACGRNFPEDHLRNSLMSEERREFDKDRVSIENSVEPRCSGRDVFFLSSPVACSDISSVELRNGEEKHSGVGFNIDAFDKPLFALHEQSKHLKGKLYSHSKRCVIEFSPEEASQLAKEMGEEIESNGSRDSLDKYREMDLAPIETVMKSESAGDLILPNTPVKLRDTFLLRGTPRSQVFQNSFDALFHDTESTPERKPRTCH